MKTDLPTSSLLLLSLSNGIDDYSYYCFKQSERSIVLVRKFINYGCYCNDTILYNIIQMIEHIRKIEIETKEEKAKWWNYCPDWIFLQLLFIHQVVRQYLVNEIEVILDGIFAHDLNESERNRLQFWMRTLADKFLESPEPSYIPEKCNFHF